MQMQNLRQLYLAILLPVIYKMSFEKSGNLPKCIIFELSNSDSLMKAYTNS